MENEQISGDDEIRIERFIRWFISHSGAGPAVVVPLDMRNGEPNSDGWIPWIPVENPLNEQAVSLIEIQIGYPLPSLFKCYLTYKCLLMTDFVVCLPQTPSSDPLKEFEDWIGLFESEPFFKENKY